MSPRQVPLIPRVHWEGPGWALSILADTPKFCPVLEVNTLVTGQRVSWGHFAQQGTLWPQMESAGGVVEQEDTGCPAAP